MASRVFSVLCRGFPACTDDARAMLSPTCKCFTACFTSSSVNHEIKSESLNIWIFWVALIRRPSSNNPWTAAVIPRVTPYFCFNFVGTHHGIRIGGISICCAPGYCNIRRKSPHIHPLCYIPASTMLQIGLRQAYVCQNERPYYPMKGLVYGVQQGCRGGLWVPTPAGWLVILPK